MAARLAILAALCLLSSLATPAAGADGEDKQRAAEQFEAGRAAMRNSDFAGACRAFGESQRLDPAPGTELNLGLCSEQLGLLATALGHYRAVARELPPDDERAQIAAKQSLALEPRVPLLTLSLAASAPSGARVTLDGAEVDPGEELQVDPGKHAVSVTAPGRDARAYELRLDEGERRALEVTAGDAIAVVAVVDDEPGLGALQVAGIAIGAVGLAGVVVGGVFGGLVLDKKATVEEQCDAEFCDSEEGIDAAESGAVFSTVSTIAFIAGAVGLGAGITLIVVGAPADDGVTLHLAPQPGGAHLSLEGRF
jgi:hypothetical protein